ncbi:MAG TPA: branched-chain amino acid ABC transporter permease, partial [bacterium]|nr:branched-chain amino acid ABC transporter permease [bacterium]
LGQSLGGVPVWLLPCGALVAGAFALLIGYPTLRIRGPHFAVATLILALMGEIFVGNLDRITGGGLGIVLPRPQGTPFLVERRFYFVFGAMAAIAALAAWWVEHSALGYTLQAIREDEDAARAVGIRAARYKILMLCLSACGAGAVGGLYGSYVGYISPDGAFDLAFSVKPVVYAVIGGLGTWAGPVIGSGLMEIVSTLLTLLSPTLKAVSQVLFGAILVAVVLAAPQGITGWLARRRAPRPRARWEAARG